MRKLVNIVVMVGVVMVVVVVNMAMIGTWVGKSGPANIGSIEVSYITMGKFLYDNFGKTWVSQWYFGYPINLNYLPVVPVSLAVLRAVGFGWWEAYRLVTAVGFVLAPLGVIFLTRQLGGKWLGGLVAGLGYSVGPSVFYWLYSGLMSDRLDALWDPRRVAILFRWGEGPHTVALIFLPWVGWAWAKYLRTQKKANFFWAMGFLALASLTNAIGWMAAVILVLVMSFVWWSLVGSGKMKVVLSTTLLLLGWLGLVSFWYNLTFLGTFFGEGGGILNRLWGLFPWGWLFVLGGVFGIWLVVKYVFRDFGLAVAVLYAGVFGAVVGVYYFSAPDILASQRVELLPQALRYLTELDLALAVVAGIVVGLFLCNKTQFVRWGGWMLGLGLVGVTTIYSVLYVPIARKHGQTSQDLNKTEEKLVADWLKSKVDSAQRVVVTGNHGYYLNYFTDVWQLRGALYQASLHKWPDHIYFQLANGEDASLATTWLESVGASYFVLPGPESLELFKDIKNKERFSNMQVVDEYRGNKLLKVNGPGVVRLVELQKQSQLPQVAKADDKQALLVYRGWLQDGASTVITKIGADGFEINANVATGQGVNVAMTYDGGWEARLVGSSKKLRVISDPLGFITIMTPPGVSKIRLTHKLTLDVYLGYLVSIGTLVTIGGYVVSRRLSTKK